MDTKRISQERLGQALKMARAGYWEYDVASDAFTFNDEFYRIYRTTAQEVGGYHMSSAEYARRFCHPDDAHLVAREVRTVIETDDADYSPQIEHRIIYSDGEIGYVAVRFIVIKDENGKTVRTFGINQDITERKLAEVEREKLQVQLLQSHKLESIGRLAGGLAHDLNNLLTPILGYTEMVREEINSEDNASDALNEIVGSAIRARELVRQLLAFSSKQVLEYEQTDLNDLVSGMQNLLQSAIPDEVCIETIPSITELPVKVDVEQIEQVILSLVLNAADAMPDGGTVTLESAVVHLDETYARERDGVKEGIYALLAVSDTGQGMDEETRQHIFEPFYSTKGEDGTGLELASVYGIIKQHGGSVLVYSELEKGTTVKVFLPLKLPQTVKNETYLQNTPLAELSGSETILLVDDNAQVREMSLIILLRRGYHVITAENAEEALALLVSYEGPVHLLLTDLVMPDADGLELGTKAVERYPDLKVLYMSGLTDNVVTNRGILDKRAAFIQKPFTLKALVAKVRQVLDGRLPQ